MRVGAATLVQVACVTQWEKSAPRDAIAVSVGAVWRA